MNLITSKKSWLTAPVLAFLGLSLILLLWSVTDPCVYVEWFDTEKAPFSPVEWMTLPLFGLIVPLVWLCPPQSGPTRRQCAWSLLWSLLSVVAIVRETDLHKIAFAQIWPDIASSFSGTVFKMRFLKAGDIPLMPKLFVLVFFIVFFVVAAIPLIRYFIPLGKADGWSGAFRRRCRGDGRGRTVGLRDAARSRHQALRNGQVCRADPDRLSGGVPCLT